MSRLLLFGAGLASLVLVVLTVSVSALVIKELDQGNLTTAISNWQMDLGVMFYAPWCQYCKQFTPFWEEIADHLQTRKTIQLRRFNCELPLSDHTDFCQELGVESYPSLYFIGYGNFYQPGSYKPNVVKYKADIYPDAILVWLRMLNTISSFQQKWDIFRSLLPFSSHRTKLTRQHSSLVEEVKTLQHQLQIFKQAADREAAWNIFNDGVDRGDVFPLLNMLDPEDKKNSPLTMCIADYALDYCRNEDPVEEAYCGVIAECVQKSMKPEKCRPATCPFVKKMGCKVLSNCLDTDVIELYKAAAISVDTMNNEQ